MRPFAFLARWDLQRLSSVPSYPFELDPSAFYFSERSKPDDEGWDTGWWIGLWERCSIGGGLQRWGITARLLDGDNGLPVFQVAIPVGARVIDPHFRKVPAFADASWFRPRPPSYHHPFDERFPGRPVVSGAPDVVYFSVPLPQKKVSERQGLVIFRDIIMRALAHELDESLAVDEKLLTDPHEAGG